MIRILLTYLVPLLLPFVFYLVWAWLVRSRKEGDPHPLTTGVYFWLLMTGFVLLGVVLGSVAYFGSSDPGGTYIPPRFEDGQVIPGRVE